VKVGQYIGLSDRNSVVNQLSSYLWCTLRYRLFVVKYV